MSEQRQARKEKQMAFKAPEGFVCGNCKKFNVYDSEKPFVCEYCGYGKLIEKE